MEDLHIHVIASLVKLSLCVQLKWLGYAESLWHVVGRRKLWTNVGSRDPNRAVLVQLLACTGFWNADRRKIWLETNRSGCASPQKEPKVGMRRRTGTADNALRAQPPAYESQSYWLRHVT